MRASDRRAVGAADRRPGAPASRGDEVHHQRAGRARPQGRVQGRLRAPARRGLHAREGGRRAARARGGDRARQEAQAHDRGRGRPARPQGGHPPPADRLGRDGARARRPAGRDRRDRRQAADLLGAVRVPVPRRRAARAGAAGVLVQLPARRLPALHGPRPSAGDRPGPARPRPDALDRGRRARPVVTRLVVQLLRRGHRGDRRPLRDRPLEAVVRPHRRGAQPLPAGHRRREDLRELPQPDGAQALLHARVRGDRREPPEALPRDRLAAAARADRGVHGAAALPGVQGRAAQARGARRHDRRPQHPRLHAHVGAAGAHVPRRARPLEAGLADRRADRQGDPRAADVPRQRRRRLPGARPRVGDALGRRGAAAAARDADRLAARRRPLHPRRAVDRPAPARQRAAHRDARAAARPRQHRPRGRARRADDALRRPPGRHGARRRRARRPRRRRGNRRSRSSAIPSR